MAIDALPSAPHDFDFAVGDWTVQHRRLKDRLLACTEWVEFSGQMSTRQVLGGYGNVEDNVLDLPEGSYRALALRSFNAQTRQWSIWWLDGRFPGQLDVPVVGGFHNSTGTFYANDTLSGVPITVRFVWLTQDPQRPRWEQAFSADGGTTWETNWTMQFTLKP